MRDEAIVSTDHPDGGESFARRWSRVKTEARDADHARSSESAAAPVGAVPAKTDDDPPALPPIEELTLESDFSGFFHPKVDEGLRRAALRKLFSDPHFNVMDGLDTYIDDYSKTEPLPAAMLASLQQAQRILEWAAETDEQAAARRAVTSPGAAEVVPEDLAAPALDATLESTPSAPDLDPAPNTKA